jgi:6-pyruvoyltetrahydropterin/6-carboxytetrahydropterin synthase
MEHHLQIDGWKGSVRFSACHILLRHDKCSRLHGHSYAIHLKVFGELDENHMLADFGRMKKLIRSYAEELDHRIIIPTTNPDIIIEEEEGGSSIKVNMLGKIYVLPKFDVVKLPIPATTVEELSKYVLTRFIEEADLPKGVEKVSIGMDEGWGQGAWSTVNIKR